MNRLPTGSRGVRGARGTEPAGARAGRDTDVRGEVDSLRRQGVYSQGHPHIPGDEWGVYDQGHRSDCGCGQGVYHQGHPLRSGHGEGVYHQGHEYPAV
jgi:hypothetical protein